MHAPSLEKKYVAEGKLLNRRLVMYNDFIVIGPEDDPAKIRGEKRAGAAFAKIAEKTALVRIGPEGVCTNGRESCSFAHPLRPEELRAAVASVTRALASAQERDEVHELVRERATMRRELEALEETVRARPEEHVAYMVQARTRGPAPRPGSTTRPGHPFALSFTLDGSG